MPMKLPSQLSRGVLFFACGSLLVWGGLAQLGWINLGKAELNLALTQFDRLMQIYFSYLPMPIAVLALCVIGTSMIAGGVRKILRMRLTVKSAS